MVQPNIVTVEGTDYRVFTDSNNINFPAAPIESYSLIRVFNLAVNTPKDINFNSLLGWWSFDSVYISSPIDSEIQVEILDSNGVVFFTDLYQRETTPRTMPTVLLNNSLSMRLTAGRSAISLVLLYLKPANLVSQTDFP